MDEISLLPQMLREQSLSHREIVLQYQEAKEALDLLRRAQWAVWGWEGWVQYLDGSHGFASGGVMGADIQRKEEKPGLTLFTDRFCFVMKAPIKNIAAGMPTPSRSGRVAGACHCDGVIVNELRWNVTYETQAGRKREQPIPGRDRLPKGRVVLTIGVPRHGRAPCLPRDPGHPTSNAKQREERCHPLAVDFPRNSRYTERCWMR